MSWKCFSCLHTWITVNWVLCPQCKSDNVKSEVSKEVEGVMYESDAWLMFTGGFG
jgi:hypothetical protein